jgi:hypothetical protein
MRLNDELEDCGESLMRFKPPPLETAECSPLVSPHDIRRAELAEELYERSLKSQLEPRHHGKFVAIEPDSGTYFLGNTLDEASAAAEKAHPTKVAYARRIGIPFVVEIGTLQ